MIVKIFFYEDKNHLEILVLFMSHKVRKPRKKRKACTILESV